MNRKHQEGGFRHSARRVRRWAQNPLTVFACCFVLAAQQADVGNRTAAQHHGRITGTVIEGTTGAPIQGARITVGDWVGTPGKPPSYPSADTQPDGSFVVRDLPADKYIISADKDGYVDRSS